MGIQNYYAAATQIINNLSELSSHLSKTLYNRLKDLRKEATFSDMTKTLQKRYKGCKAKLYKIQDMVFVPIHAQRHKTNLCFSFVFLRTFVTILPTAGLKFTTTLKQLTKMY